MTCGPVLGILLVFLVQAEHVGCLWTREAQRFQNSNTYVGFPPADVRLIKSGSYPQNQVRQGFISPHSVHSSSSNTGPAVYSVSGPGLPTRSSTQAVSQPAQSSVRLVQSSSMFKANRQKLSSPRTNAPNILTQSSGLSGGASVSQHHKNPSDIGRRSLTLQQEMQRSNRYPSSSSQTIHGPREGYSFRPVSQSAAQEPSRAAVKIPPYSQTGSSAVLFGPVAPGQHGRSVQMQTYARGPARRVFSNRRFEEPKAKRFSPQAKAWKQSVSSRPRSWLQMYKTRHNLAVPRSSTVDAFAPAIVYQIPEHFGGFAIRRS